MLLKMDYFILMQIKRSIVFLIDCDVLEVRLDITELS